MKLFNVLILCLAIFGQFDVVAAEQSVDADSAPNNEKVSENAQAQANENADEDAQQKNASKSEQSQRVSITAHYLGSNQALNEDVESIIVFQIIDSQLDGDLAKDRIVLCHNALPEAGDLQLDAAYAITLSQQANTSAVAWVLEKAERVFLKENDAVNDQADKLLGSEEGVAADEVQREDAISEDFRLLDTGKTWLLMSPQAGKFKIGDVQVDIKSLELSFKAHITANDKRFIILSAKQLAYMNVSNASSISIRIKQ